MTDRLGRRRAGIESLQHLLFGRVVGLELFLGRLVAAERRVLLDGLVAGFAVGRVGSIVAL